MENQVDWKNEVRKTKCGNKGSETKQWQQGYFAAVAEIRFDCHGKVRIQTPNRSREWERGERQVPEFVITSKVLYKCVSSLSGSKESAT